MRITFRDTDTKIIQMLNTKGGVVVARAAEGLKKGLASTKEVVTENVTGGVIHEWSGDLLESLGYGPLTITTESVDLQLVIGGPGAWYAPLLEYGVPHTWVETTRRGTQGKKRGGGVMGFEVGGETLFRKTVTHPAMEAKPYFAPALDATTEQIVEDVQAEIAKVVNE